MKENDIQVLLASSIDTADEPFFRWLDEAMLDSFSTNTFYGNPAEWDADCKEAVSHERNPEVYPGEFRSGKSAANLSRLGMATRTLAKKDIERMTAEVQDDKLRKISAAVIQDEFAKASRRGGVKPNGRVRPDNVTMSKVMENFRICRSFRRLGQEEFVSKQDEERTVTRGLKEKSFVIFEDTMQLRSLAFDKGEICSKDEVDALYCAYMDARRSAPPFSSRTPYMLEIRLPDKHSMLLKNVLDGQGTIGNGTTFFLSEPGRTNRVWKRCEQMPVDYPDRVATQSVSKVAIYYVNNEQYNGAIVAGWTNILISHKVGRHTSVAAMGCLEYVAKLLVFQCTGEMKEIRNKVHQNEESHQAVVKWPPPCELERPWTCLVCGHNLYDAVQCWMCWQWVHAFACATWRLQRWFCHNCMRYRVEPLWQGPE